MIKKYAFNESGVGYFIRTQKEQFNITNFNHMKYQEKINDLLGIGK